MSPHPAPGGTDYLLSGNQVITRVQSRSAGSSEEISAFPHQQVYYDACGRMVLDSDKSISKIVYDELNLPSSIQYAATDNSTAAPDTYGIQYAADGRKQRTGRIVSAMKQFNNVNVFDCGFITALDGRYHFFVTNHFVNVRVVVSRAAE